MKRKGNLFQLITDIDNLRLADYKAQKGKKHTKEVIRHNQNAEANLQALQKALVKKTFTTSPYKNFTIKDPKERVISKLPYYPDRIVHHAIMNVLEPAFVSHFTANTYSCIKGRGLHKAARKLKHALKDTAGTKYCLKLDIKQFYPSVNNTLLKQQLRRKFKDPELLWLLDNIIDSTKGLPIGNYLSQYFGNFYLSGFDHWIKEMKKVKYYFRYCDDVVILHHDKTYLHQLRVGIKQYLSDNLRLTVKHNYRVFPVTQGIDYLGYVFFRTHTLLRKSIKQRFCRMLKRNPAPASIAAYNGWLKHCNSRNLLTHLNLAA